MARGGGGGEGRGGSREDLQGAETLMRPCEIVLMSPLTCQVPPPPHNSHPLVSVCVLFLLRDCLLIAFDTQEGSLYVSLGVGRGS